MNTKKAEVIISHKIIAWLENFTSLEELQAAIVNGALLDLINSIQELPLDLKEFIYYTLGNSIMSGGVSLNEAIEKLRALSGEYE
ncbi:MAG: hypothetical protein ACD_7C00086G0001 [uncultured bacterium]|nr:MAG: hypothetical protein ACD_7C00086G0001 [uncultured bacterium]